MALKLTDRVVETTQTTGTGVIDLLGAQTGFRTFGADLTSGDTTPYVIVDDPNEPTAYEYGIGTWTSGSPNTLARTTIQGSSNGGNAISLQSGQTYVVTGSLTWQFFLDYFGGAALADIQSSPTDTTPNRLALAQNSALVGANNSFTGNNNFTQPISFKGKGLNLRSLDGGSFSRTPQSTSSTSRQEINVSVTAQPNGASSLFVGFYANAEVNVVGDSSQEYCFATFDLWRGEVDSGENIGRTTVGMRVDPNITTTWSRWRGPVVIEAREAASDHGGNEHTYRVSMQVNGSNQEVEISGPAGSGHMLTVTEEVR